MGAPDNRLFSKLIPKEDVGRAASWEFEPLDGARANSAPLTDRDRRAFERGLAQGRREGLEQADSQRAQHAQTIARVADALRARFAELESAGADALLDLALEVAQQVVRRHLAVRRDAVLPVLREAVAQVIEQQAHPRVHLNPNDLELFRAELDADGLLKGCRFIPDAHIGHGGCRVETNVGDIDARLATRWRRLAQALGSELAWTDQDAAGDGAE